MPSLHFLIGDFVASFLHCLHTESLDAAMNQTVGILGGMGPSAGAAFAATFVRACTDRLNDLGVAVADQAYPEHWLVQTPIADRMTALLASDGSYAAPLQGMTVAMTKMSMLGVRTVAIACNTAHAWHGDLQSLFPNLEVLHIVRELIQELNVSGVRCVGLLATEGTYAMGLYAKELALGGIECVIPTAQERAVLTEGIYAGVKSNRLDQATACFTQVANALCVRERVQTLILGCTEIPLGLQTLPSQPDVRLINPAEALARTLARRAIPAVRH